MNRFQFLEDSETFYIKVVPSDANPNPTPGRMLILDDSAKPCITFNVNIYYLQFKMICSAIFKHAKYSIVKAVKDN